ncbi:hypothetical protein B0H14DRAFT_2558382 [Mycena olivaceomarginata]|nr:hypothetical protein B0H14DRAFT_2558382 [Mycena olivaceomarginata]
MAEEEYLNMAHDESFKYQQQPQYPFGMPLRPGLEQFRVAWRKKLKGKWSKKEANLECGARSPLAMFGGGSMRARSLELSTLVVHWSRWWWYKELLAETDLLSLQDPEIRISHAPQSNMKALPARQRAWLPALVAGEREAKAFLASRVVAIIYLPEKSGVCPSSPCGQEWGLWSKNGRSSLAEAGRGLNFYGQAPTWCNSTVWLNGGSSKFLMAGPDTAKHGTADLEFSRRRDQPRGVLPHLIYLRKTFFQIFTAAE